MTDDLLSFLPRKPDNQTVSFENLMPRRVRDVLVVANPYDSFTIEQDGRLSESLFSDYLELNLRYAPHIDKVTTAREALLLLETSRYDLVISMMRLGDMTPRGFSRAAREIQPDLPVVFLTFSSRETAFLDAGALDDIDRVFMWRGDARLFLAMIKSVEDKLNALHDAKAVGVQCLILVEDSVPFYSSYLPMLYTEIMMQTRSLMSEGANRAQQLLRMHARPKVLLATSYEEAVSYYERYHDHLLGAIIDASFPREGRLDPLAGHRLAERIAADNPDAALLIQSSDQENAARASRIGASFINKRSASLLHEVREFMKARLGFGDFVFRMPDDTVVATAKDLKTLAEAIRTIPAESLQRHSRRKDFSTWLKARTEFTLAKAIRARKMASFASLEDFRAHLIDALDRHRSRSREGIVADFSIERFEGGAGFVKIGGGSMGGKGRGLAFFNSLLTEYDIQDRIPGVRLFLPPTAVLATEVFDAVMESEELTALTLERDASDGEIAAAFDDATLPPEASRALLTFLERVRYPLAVRSSSLLEDASAQPFAGIYRTYMIANNEDSIEDRLASLTRAIKRVYASTFSCNARSYLASTPNRLEEEKMAVVIQEVFGRAHGQFLYPDIAGVARSHNHYPIGELTPDEGIVCAVLGLGRPVVEGGRCTRFSPRKPAALFSLLGPRDFLQMTQRELFALDTSRFGKGRSELADDVVRLELGDATRHGTLDIVCSTYSPSAGTMTDGADGPGVKLVTFARLLKDPSVRLGEAISFLLDLGRECFSSPVEMEFAVKLDPTGAGSHELGFLQMRPMTVTIGGDGVRDLPRARVICSSRKAVGPGGIEPVLDVVHVRRDRFDRALTSEIAEEIGEVNARLAGEGRRYVLIGPGRWGSADERLGIPVAWGQISNVSALVETAMSGIKVSPSQGSHFFHNVTSFGVGCLSIDFEDDGGFLDAEWLEAQPAHFETPHVRHLRFDAPVRILIDGTGARGLILKPDGNPDDSSPDTNH